MSDHVERDAEPQDAGCPSDALSRAWRIQTDASREGFDWDHISGVLAKAREEVTEIEQALARNDLEQARSELGDLLFAAVNVARFLDAGPAGALNAATTRFERRYARLSALIRCSGRIVKDCSMEELDRVWEAVKREA